MTTSSKTVFQPGVNLLFLTDDCGAAAQTMSLKNNPVQIHIREECLRQFKAFSLLILAKETL